MDKVELKKYIDEADLVLVGFGEEFDEASNSITELEKAYNEVHKMICGKNYFVVSLNKDPVIFASNFDEEKITAPFSEEIKTNEDGDDVMWDKYMMWLSCTLNKKLLIVELGVLLNAPQVIRWPFEKTVMLNNKANLIRINETIPNIPADIKEKAYSVQQNAVDFILG